MSDLSLIYGESRILDLAVTDENDAVVNITGSSLWFTVKDDYLDADADALITLTIGSGITVTDAPNGLAEIAIAPADWTSFANEPTRVVFGVTEKDAALDVWRLDRGTLLVGPAVQETV